MGTKVLVDNLNGLRLQVAQAQETLDTINATVKKQIVVRDGIVADLIFKSETLNKALVNAQKGTNDAIEQKNQVERDIANLLAKKDLINADIVALQKKSNLVSSNIADAAIALDDLNDQYKNLQEAVSDTQKVKESLEGDISSLQDAIKGLNDKKDQSDKDYMASAKRLISISDREDALKQREEYIKGRYDTAGIPYQPIS